ncbi:MAG: DEAD/DEAH box helicase [Treponema sp.]|nr:DEAD/DEAH box helicase [Treponema sp.]
MARQSYGVTPWGKWFIDVLDSYRMDARLNRGKTYANTGKVLSLEFNERKAVAKVKGNYRPSYKVEIEFPPLEEQEKAEVLRLIEEDTALVAQIAAGELPESFLQKLKRSGINLIPKRWKDMRRSCNCPDYGDPCKHEAAIYYVIAREIDADPHILFRLRGIDLAVLTAKFGAGLETAVIEPPFSVESGPAERETPALPPEFPAIPHCAGLILSLLAEAPFQSGKDFTVALAEFYHRAARADVWQYTGKDEGRESLFSHSQWTLECAPAHRKQKPKPGADLILVRHGISGETEQYTVYEALSFFRSFSSEKGTLSYTFLYYTAKFLGLLCVSEAFIPSVLLEDGELCIVWQPFKALPAIRGALESLSLFDSGILELESGGKRKKAVYADGRSTVTLLASAMLGEYAKRSYTARRGTGELVQVFFQGTSLDVSSPAVRSLPLAVSKWLSVLHTDFSGGRRTPPVPGVVPVSEAVPVAVTADDASPRKAPGSSPVAGSMAGAAYTYRLLMGAPVQKKGGDAAADREPEFSLAMEVLFEREDATEKAPLKDAAKLTGSIEVLKAPTLLSHYLPELRSLLSRKTVKLAGDRLSDFLDNAAPLLETLGIELVFPKSLRRELKPRLVLQASAKEGAKAGSLVSYLNLNSLLDWQWQVAIGDELISREEFAALLAQKRAVVQFHNTFVRIDPAELSRLLRQTEARAPGLNDFLKYHLSGDSVLAFDAKEIIEKLFNEREYTVPPSLKAELRPYQQRGYNWICSLLYAGFGCILADDMGLGKTVQSIAAMLRLNDDGLLGDGCLIIAPAALLSNWERELARFAPSLRVFRYHGAGRHFADACDVMLTTYQTAARDNAKLVQHTFSLLVVDEAHLMKNAEAKSVKAVKQLRSRFTLALSGTPVENRLEDLRSLFDFVLPGYLGTAAQFKDAYRYPVEVMRNREAAEKLKKITAPFLLRRLKTDKAVISDLPEKIISNEYALLEKGQAALYESVVTEILKKSEQIEEGQGRSALILTLLTSLKQICDHPRVYDKESPALSSLSGKAQLLLTLLEEILTGGEKTLIFSQYVETLDCLEQIIRKEMGEAALCYHGGLSQKNRAAVISRFQNDPASRILLVSLRAGGLGLNLTAASRVIHYDLWYNPAVENQATDRSFRIGQTRNVFVHRFITRNSFEEKIDAMLTAKRELADMTVSSGESWLARMSHEELKTLFDR